MPRIIMVPSGVDDYRAKAAECEQKEKEARDPEVKRVYLGENFNFGLERAI